MNTSLIWIGIIPVLAFVILDSFAEKRKALIGALVLGAAELAFTLIKFKILDYLTIVAFGLLALLVAVSLKTKNDFYFKIQGAVVNLIFAVTLIIFQYVFEKIVMLDMAIKYIGLKNLADINPVLNEKMLASMLTAVNTQLPWWLIIHSGLTIYAARKWNKWVWVSIRVPGFYLMLFVATQSAMISV